MNCWKRTFYCITLQIPWRSRSTYIPFKVTLTLNINKWKFVIVWINIASSPWIKKTKEHKNKKISIFYWTAEREHQLLHNNPNILKIAQLIYTIQSDLSITLNKWKLVIMWINIASTHWIKKDKTTQKQENFHSLLNCWKGTFYSITVQIPW